jgi:hypothetical protein
VTTGPGRENGGDHGRRRRILLTNFVLAGRSGTELYVWDLANALLARGHTPIVYSTQLGPLSAQLREATIPVVDDLASVGAAPDVIHGQHNHELLTALLQFPRVPAVRFCHGWNDDPVQPFPRVLRYVCVDDTTHDRVVLEWGIPESRTCVLLNFVDLHRFRPRGGLPPRPRRALVFSNKAIVHLPAVRQACARFDIAVEAIGASVGASAHPETVLPRYDLVFAKGRSALEALATGAAVVLCDATGVGPMVTTAELDRLRRLNFGLRALREPATPEAIAAEIARYDPGDAAEVSGRVRAAAGMDAAVDHIVEIYEEVIAEWQGQAHADREPELQAAARYLRSLAPRLYWHSSARSGLYVALRDLYYSGLRIPGLRALLGSYRVARSLRRALRY